MTLYDADLSSDGRLNARDVFVLMNALIGVTTLPAARGTAREWSGKTAIKLYTDVPEDDASRVCREVDAASLGEKPTVNFAMSYGQFVNKVTIPATIAEGGSLSVRLLKLDGEGKTKYEWNFFFDEAQDGVVTLDMTDLIDGHSFLGAGLYAIEIAGSANAKVIERNAVIRAVAEGRRDLLRAVAHGRADLRKAAAAQQQEDMLHQAAPEQRHERLGRLARHAFEPFSLAACQNDRLHALRPLFRGLVCVRALQIISPLHLVKSKGF